MDSLIFIEILQCLFDKNRNLTRTHYDYIFFSYKSYVGFHYLVKNKLKLTSLQRNKDKNTQRKAHSEFPLFKLIKEQRTVLKN